MNFDISHGIAKLYHPNGGWNFQLYYPSIRIDKKVGLQILIALFEFRLHPQTYSYAIVVCGFGCAIQYKSISIPPEIKT